MPCAAVDDAPWLLAIPVAIALLVFGIVWLVGKWDERRHRADPRRELDARAEIER